MGSDDIIYGVRDKMLMKGYIRKESQAITIHSPTGVGTDGERIYGAGVSAFAVVSPITEEQRDVFGGTVANIVFLILAEYSIQIGSKIIWDSKTYIIQNFRELFDFHGRLFAYEVAVNA